MVNCQVTFRKRALFLHGSFAKVTRQIVELTVATPPLLPPPLLLSLAYTMEDVVFRFLLTWGDNDL